MNCFELCQPQQRRTTRTLGIAGASRVDLILRDNSKYVGYSLSTK